MNVWKLIYGYLDKLCWFTNLKHGAFWGHLPLRTNQPRDNIGMGSAWENHQNHGRSKQGKPFSNRSQKEGTLPTSYLAESIVNWGWYLCFPAIFGHQWNSTFFGGTPQLAPGSSHAHRTAVAVKRRKGSRPWLSSTRLDCLGTGNANNNTKKNTSKIQTSNIWVMIFH